MKNLSSDWVLGIDIGGTGSRAALEPLGAGIGTDGSTAAGSIAAGSTGAGADARRARRVRDGGRVEIGSSGSGLVEVAAALIADCLRAWPDVSPVAVGIGATGLASLVAEPDAALRRLGSVVPGVPVALAIDAVTAHLGALGGRGGAVVAVGTGAIAIGTDLREHWARVGGWGHLFDDRGSGAWIGIEGLKAAIRTFDGVTDEASALLDAATDRFGPAPTWAGQLLTRPDRAGVLAGFARDVSDVADAGDRVARDILDRAGREVAATLAAALRPGVPRLAAGTGGVFGGRAFASAFEEEFVRRAPDAELVPSVGSPLDGAVELGRLAVSGELPGARPPYLWSARP